MRAEEAANHIDLNVNVEQGYDSNIFLTKTNEIGSAVTTIRPTLGFQSEDAFGHVRIEGFLSSHIFWNESGLNGTDRGVGVDVDRIVVPRLALFGRGSYQRVAPHDEIRGASVITVNPEPGTPGQVVVQPGDLIAGSVPNVDIGQGEIGGRYQLTPRNRLSVSGGPYMTDYLSSPNVQSEFRDGDGWFARATLDHTLSLQDGLHFTAAASGSNLDDLTVPFQTIIGPVPLHAGTSTTNQQSLSIGWDRTWNEYWTTSFSIGVRRLDSETLGASRKITRVIALGGTVQPFVTATPTDFNSVGPGVIGSFSIIRELPRGSLALSYSREARTIGVVSVSDVNVDSFVLSYLHRLSARATFSLVGTFEHYASVEDVPQFLPASYIDGSFNPITGPEFACADGRLVVSGSGPRKGGQCEVLTSAALQSNYWNAVARVDWQLRKRLYTYLALRYENRNGDEALFGNNYGRFNAGVGFTYAYDLGL